MNYITMLKKNILRLMKLGYGEYYWSPLITRIYLAVDAMGVSS